MKFSVFALIAGLCLVAAANAQLDIDIDFGSVDLRGADISDFGIFNGFLRIVKVALRSLKGVHCTINAVLEIRTAAQQFIADIEACGGDVSKQVQALINQCKAIIQTSNNIINLNDQICNSADYGNQASSNPKTPSSCSVKLVKQLVTLKNQIKKALKMIQKIPKVGTDAGVCSTKAANDLSQPFTNFPGYVMSCSKLTSN